MQRCGKQIFAIECPLPLAGAVNEAPLQQGRDGCQLHCAVVYSEDRLQRNISIRYYGYG